MNKNKWYDKIKKERGRNMKNKKIIFILSAIFFILLIGTIRVNATLELNELKFDAQINTDGSMDVTETWDIDISETNTLFKTFKIDNSKYSQITNVNVAEITSGEKYFTQIYEEMYHVTKNCYYALENSKGEFEIAWGVGLDNSSARREYQISYTVQDAIAKYNDYSQLYWQFVGDNFEIDANKIIGTITLPQNADKKENIKVWGHTKDLNGEIYVTELNKIEFTINNYSSGNYVEVRALIPNEMILFSDRNYNYDILDSVIEEETQWANEANARRQMQRNTFYIIIGIAIITTIFFIAKTIKYIIKLNKLEKKYKPTTKLQYFRELPYEDATPAEAIYVISDASDTSFSGSFSANILDLCLKKYITLELINQNGKIKKDNVKIKILDKEIEELKEDEKLTLNFIKEVANEENELTTEDITKYFKLHSSEITNLNVKIEKIVEKEETKRENIKLENQKEERNYKTNCAFYIFAIYIFMVVCYIIRIFIPVEIIFVLNAILTGMIAHKINIFTQKGVDEKEQWKAFKKYMEDFSLLKDKEVPALVVWEKYLVFATAFGISEKVLKQLKVIYPEITDKNYGMYTYSYIHIMNSVNIGNCINSSVYSAISSSGSGAGGGFSGGGGGGRWPEVAEADAKIELIDVKFY